MTRATVITDASYCQKTGSAGWAAWVRVDDRLEAIRRAGPIKQRPKTSTFAEVYAALNGLWLAIHHGATEVLLQTDCMTVIHLNSGQCKSPELVDLWNRSLARADMQAKVQTKHVKGHNLHRRKDARTWVNDWCDKQARVYMEKGRKQ